MPLFCVTKYLELDTFTLKSKASRFLGFYLVGLHFKSVSTMDYFYHFMLIFVINVLQIQKVNETMKTNRTKTSSNPFRRRFKSTTFPSKFFWKYFRISIQTTRVCWPQNRLAHVGSPTWKKVESTQKNVEKWSKSIQN